MVNDQVAMFTFNDITQNQDNDADIQFTIPADQYFDLVTLEPEDVPSDVPDCCPFMEEWTVINCDVVRGKCQDAAPPIEAGDVITNNQAPGDHCVRADMEG